jgi:hypothetical protein
MRQNVTSATSKSNANASRRGVALVMFVMLVFAFMGMAALCIDMGMASLTQAQMQNAVDSAALEGISGRDALEHRVFSDRGRRRLAATMVRNVFDDDFVPSANDSTPDGGHYSAGPIVHLEDGIGEDNASALLSVPEPSTYQPDDKYLDDPSLETRPSVFGTLLNRPHGDIVSGTFIQSGSHSETSSYVRDDFDPAASYQETWRALSFLVRMRRTGDSNLLDNVQDVSSSGPTVPFIFGLGSAIHGADGDDYNPRRDGLTVRATAIASVVPVYSIGPLLFTEDCTRVVARNWPAIPHMRAVYGLGPVAIEKSFWMSSVGPFDNSQATYVPLTLDHISGELRSGTGALAGRLYFGDTSAMPCPTRASSALSSIGDPLDVPFSTSWVSRLLDWLELIRLTPTNAGPFANSGRCYIPIYTDISGVPRVIGFVQGTILLNPDSPPTAIRIDLDRGFPDQNEVGIHPISAPCVMLVGPENANGRLSQRTFSLSEADRERVFSELIELTYIGGEISHDWRDIREGALLAPALVR